MDTAVTVPVHPSQGSVRTMTVEEGHVLNIDGVNNSAANKYKQQENRKGERSMSAVSRGSAFQVTSSDVEEGGHGGDPQPIGYPSFLVLRAGLRPLRSWKPSPNYLGTGVSPGKMLKTLPPPSSS